VIDGRHERFGSPAGVSHAASSRPQKKTTGSSFVSKLGNEVHGIPEKVENAENCGRIRGGFRGRVEESGEIPCCNSETYWVSDSNNPNIYATISDSQSAAATIRTDSGHCTEREHLKFGRLTRCQLAFILLVEGR
jgi:hypothetical protein